MKNYKVSLSFQCNEDWNKMTPMEKGRHCGACNKVVIDFSSMTDSQIVNYLLENKNTCGKFNTTQLNRTYTIYSIKKRNTWPAIAAMLVAGMFSLSAPTLNAGVHGNMDISSVHGGTTLWAENAPGAPGLLKIDPKKIGKIRFVIRLYAKETKERIFNGSVIIEGLGTFNAEANGDINIEFGGKEAPAILQVGIHTGSHGFHSYRFNKSDLKNSVQADLYLEEQIMPAGTVAIEEQ